MVIVLRSMPKSKRFMATFVVICIETCHDMIGPRAHIIDTIITQFSKVYIMYIPTPILNLK